VHNPKNICVIDGCERTVRARGWCAAHYERWLKRGDPLAGGPIRVRLCGTPAERFWAKVNIRAADECWEWQAFTTPKGYGRFNTGTGASSAWAHRYAYELLVGPIPDGLVIDHLCRNPGCCNPVHMEPVTAVENTMRGHSFSAVNAAKTHCVRGHPLAGSNLGRDGKSGKRWCRTCRYEINRKNYLRRKQNARDGGHVRAHDQGVHS
jgi:hypothetical protein